MRGGGGHRSLSPQNSIFEETVFCTRGTLLLFIAQSKKNVFIGRASNICFQLCFVYFLKSFVWR